MAGFTPLALLSGPLARALDRAADERTIRAIVKAITALSSAR